MREYVQYTAIMLLRILADNPGATFTRNLDSKFVATVKDLLRDGRDMSVQQILRETLDTFELQKADDETLRLLITMWQNEKAKWAKRTGNDISSAVVSARRWYDLPTLTIDRCRTIEPGEHHHLHQDSNRFSHHQIQPPRISNTQETASHRPTN